MQQRRVERQEAELEVERRAKFKGTARIRLEYLEFPRYETSENVERLKLCIEYQGCYRLESRYHVPAVIDQQLLDVVIQASSTSHAALLSDSQSEWPTLRVPPGIRLECLRGWDRLRAGWESLPPKDRWWTVDLYRNDISEALKRSFREAFSNEGHPSDGQIYRQIRLYSLQGNADAEGQWWALLSPNKRRDLKRLLNQRSRRRYAAALDALLDLTGLWDGVRGGMWKKMMDLGCEEAGHLRLPQKPADRFGGQEVLHYLEHIRIFWSTLLQDDVQWMRRLDHITVKALERKAPGASVTDLAFLYSKIQKGAMFQAFDEQERNTILHALQSLDGLVPSFDTFFEDFKYLQIWGQCAKTLVKVRPGGTVFTALEQSFDDSHQQVDRCIVQVAPSDFTSVPGSITDRVNLGYRQLFLYVMRHHREMIPGSTKMERRGRKKTSEGIRIPEEVDKLAWYRFAVLADQLGFTSVGIASLKSMNEATTEVPSKQAKPSFVSAGSGESPERRSGCPYDRAYKQSQRSLFLDEVHTTDKSQGCGITPFFVRRSIYLAFLGHLPFESPTAASMPVTEERPLQHTPDQSTVEPDPGQGETVPVETTQREAIRGEPTPGNAPRDPSVLQSYLRGSYGERDEEERLMLNDVVPTEDHPADRDVNNGMGLGETPIAYGRWPSEAPSIVGSSYYSEDEAIQGAAAASAIYPERAANGINACVKFVLRDGRDWVDMEELSIDAAEPSTSSAVERVAEAHTSKRRFLFNTALRSLAPSECLDAVVGDGTNVVLLIPEGSVKIDHALSMSARMLGMNAQRVAENTVG